jgi:PucR C-terminal helix-turn-helix domain/GGDEF-like domain
MHSPWRIEEHPISTDGLDAVRALVAAMWDGLDEVIERSIDRVGREVPDLARLDGEESGSTQRASARMNFEAILALLLSGVPDGPVGPPEVTRERIRRMVELGIDLKVMLHSLRLGHAELWASWQSAACRFGLPIETLESVLDYSSAIIFGYIDHVSDACAEEYSRRQLERTGSMAAARAEIVGQLISGTETDIQRASTRLAYDLRRPHLGYIVWRESPDDSFSTATLERVATAVAERLGIGRPLMVEGDGLTIWAWGITRGPGSDPPDELESYDPGVPGVRIACGSVREGLSGFVLTHEEAVVCREHMRRPQCGTVVAAYPEIALASLLCADRSRAGRYMREVLGPLAVDNDRMATLRSTLALLYSEGRSWSKTAQRIGVHANTVGLRVAKIEELLGRSVHGANHDLMAAIAIAHTLPDELITGTPGQHR